MTAGEFLARSTTLLTAAGVATARLDVLVLLEDVLNTNRAQIFAQSDLLISDSDLKKLNKLIVRRAGHEPLAYIRGRTEFYGRTFYIDNRVLEPRPESEAMIELLKRMGGPARSTIIDVGTGSGALAITAKLELHTPHAVALDIDAGCLAVARKNARQLSAEITFLQSDLLQKVTRNQLRDTVLLCNLPYVPDNFQINTAAGHEPRLAIFGGGDGLDVYRKLFDQLGQRQDKPRYIVTESLPSQHEALGDIASSNGFVPEESEDFIQVFRTAADSSAS